MNTSTCKSNFLNGLIVHILIFIFISPWEPKQTFDYLAMATGHYPFHVVQIISKEAACVAFWTWWLADVLDTWPFPYFGFKSHASF